MVAHLWQRDTRASGNFRVETLTVLFQVLEDWGIVHLEYLSEKLVQQSEQMTKRAHKHAKTDKGLQA
jgi:hypothetical protein